MSGSNRWRILGIAVLLVLFSFLAAANFVPKADRVASSFWPNDGLRLGLDLRGGIHWVVGVKLDNAITQELEFVRKTIDERLADEELSMTSSKVENLQLELVPKGVTDRAKALEFAEDSGVLEAVSDSGGTLIYRLSEDWTTAVSR